MLYHGQDDPTIPWTFAKTTYEYFKQNEFNCTIEVEPKLRHWLSDKEMNKMQ